MNLRAAITAAAAIILAAATATTIDLATTGPTTTPASLPPTNTCQPISRLGQPPKTGTWTIPAGCWTTASTVTVQGASGLAIDGTGATLTLTAPARENTWQPILQLAQDTNTTVTGLTLAGAGPTGGVNYEGDYGIVLEADTGLALTGVTVEDVPGDCLALMPRDVHIAPIPHVGDPQSSSITVAGGKLIGCGYHGVTIEAVTGLSVTGEHISMVAVDAIDQEYDGSGSPPQTNVSFTGDTFSGDHFDVVNVANVGGVARGFTFTGNALTGPTPAILAFRGHNGDIRNVTIADNTSQYAQGGPNPQDTIWLQDVQGATVTGNTFPWYAYEQPAGHEQTPKVAVESTNGSTNVVVEDNTFIGAGHVVRGPVVHNCGNTYLVNAWQAHQTTEKACP